MECRNDGILVLVEMLFNAQPSSHHSNVPAFHYSPLPNGMMSDNVILQKNKYCMILLPDSLERVKVK